MSDCLVCREVAGEVELPGGFLLDEERVLGFHVFPPEPDPGHRHYLGHLMVVTRRHAPGFEDLEPEEAADVGAAVARVARAMRADGGADHVFVARIGTGVPHLHVHLLARYPDTPRDLAWHAVDEWEGARRGTAAEVAALVERLRGSL